MVTRVPPSLLRHRIGVEPYQGDGAYGPVYGSLVVHPALVSSTVRMVRAADGRAVTSTAQIIAAPDLNCPPGSRVTLPGGRVTTVIASTGHTAPGLPVPASTEVMAE